METLHLLIPLSLVPVALIVWALLWAVRTGQFDDLEGPAYRVLLDGAETVDRRRGPGGEGRAAGDHPHERNQSH